VFIEVEDIYREFLDSARITVLAEKSVLYASQYWGIHGLSLLVEVYRGGVKRSILMDVGQDPQVLIHNMSVAGVDPGSIDAIVLSHCHYDHTGGVAEVVKRIGRRELPVIAHPSIFRVNLKTDPFLKYIGVRSGDSRDSIERSGGRLVLSRDPVKVMPGALTTGEVKRVFGFERVEGFKTTTERGNS
jgi:7,8-dihydropterin-6-yl-methyl-4-(beta-D-ribofuranosyl)aminobenzene 5'-phosphate synthase